MEQYQNLFSVNNHPGCLLFEKEKPKNEKINSQSQSNNGMSSVDREAEISEKSLWWENVYNKNKSMVDIANGNKIVLLIQILVLADMVNDKVVVFSQRLNTLDFIEEVLRKPDWSQYVPSIKNLCPGKSWGKWRKNEEYLRIDGSTSSKERGNLVERFNEKQDIKRLEQEAKVFLISSMAGNVGINLVAANRVIIFDSHWNPAVDLQALYRCYRYGQEKPVFAYRLLTEGETIRQVNAFS